MYCNAQLIIPPWKLRNINPQFIVLRSKMRTLSIFVVFRGFSRTISHECRLRCQVFVGLTGCLAGVWSGFYMILEIGYHTADYKPLVILNSCFSKCPSWDAFSKSSEFANFVQSISNQHEWYMLVIRTLGSCAGVCFLRKQMLWFDRKHSTDLWLCLVMLLFQSQCVIEFLRFAPIPLSSSRSVRTKRDTTIRM